MSASSKQQDAAILRALIACVSLFAIVAFGFWFLGHHAKEAAQEAQTGAAGALADNMPNGSDTYRHDAQLQPTSSSDRGDFLPSQKWGVDYIVDAETGSKTKAAYFIQENGYRFAIYRLKGRVYSTFMLPQNGLEAMDSRLPTLRVDYNKTVDLEIIKPMAPLLAAQGITFSVQRPTWATVHMHSGEGYPKTHEMLYQLMYGRKLWVGYWTAGGASRQIGFDLIGSKAAITEALNLGPGR